MIEKLKPIKSFDCSDTPQAKMQHHSYHNDCINKINELVDAVNALVYEHDKDSDWYDGQTRPENVQPDAESRPENVQDRFAEQRKWIGKLCWFSDGYGFDEVGYLTEIDPDMPEAKFRCNCHDYYEECKPVKPDDDIIYQGE